MENKRKRKSLRVGDRIVRLGQVYQIFRIEKKKTNGKAEKIIHFKPFFKNRSNKTLTCSIPVNNLAKANIRRSISRKGLRKLFQGFSEKTKKEQLIDIHEASNALGLNDIHKAVQVMKSFWIGKNKQAIKFSKSQQDIYQLSKDRLEEETASVEGLSLLAARKKISAALKRINLAS